MYKTPHILKCYLKKKNQTKESCVSKGAMNRIYSAFLFAMLYHVCNADVR